MAKRNIIDRLRRLVARCMSWFWTALSLNLPLWCLYSALLSIPCCLKAGESGGFHFAKMWLLTGVVSSVVMATVLFGLAVAKKWAKFLISSVLWLLYFLDFFLFAHFGTRMTNRVIALVEQTNREESGEFMDKYLLEVPTLYALAACVVLAAGYYIFRFLWRKSGKTVLEAAGGVRRKAGFLAVNVLSVIVVGIGLFTNLFYEQISYPTLEQLAVSMSELGSSRRIVKEVEAAIGLTDGKMSADAPDKIIYVIGESFGRRHTPLYGYPLATTPRMQQERDSGNLLVFEDAVTPFPSTIHVLESVFATGDDPDRQWSQPIFPAIFRHAGYRVTLHDIMTTRFIGDVKWNAANMVFFNSPAVEKRSLDYRNDRISTYDAAFMAAEIDSMKKYAWASSCPSLSIFHMRGQHMPAANRYPEGFGRFSQDDYVGRSELSGRQRQEVAHYDNATYYNDSVMGLFFDALSGQDAVLIYHSDHGEEIHDYRDQYGRTMEPVNRDIADVIYHIPFVVYTTPRFRQRHPELYRCLEKASSLPLTVADMSQMLMGLGGIESRFYDPRRDVLDDLYDNASGRRILDYKVDYDKLMKGFGGDGK